MAEEKAEAEEGEQGGGKRARAWKRSWFSPEK